MIALLLGPGHARAQDSTYTVSGFVVDKDTHFPVPDAVVTIEQVALVYTDSTGHFTIPGITTPSVVLDIRRIGYDALTADLDLDSTSAVVNLVISLQASAFRLSPIDADLNDPRLYTGPLNDFIRRMRSGFGEFVTGRDIEIRQPRQVSDMFYGLRGVRVSPCGPSGTDNCIEFRRQATIGNSCPPTYYIDGLRLTDINIDQFLEPEMIVGMEVYAGPSQTPARFNSVGNCGGVIVIWTK